MAGIGANTALRDADLLRRQLIAVASGERSKSELLGLGDNEFVPWQIGATM